MAGDVLVMVAEHSEAMEGHGRWKDTHDKKTNRDRTQCSVMDKTN